MAAMAALTAVEILECCSEVQRVETPSGDCWEKSP